MAFPASNNCGNGSNSTDRVIYIGETSSDSEESDASFSQETDLNAAQTTALRVNSAVLGTGEGDTRSSLRTVSSTTSVSSLEMQVALSSEDLANGVRVCEYDDEEEEEAPRLEWAGVGYVNSSGLTRNSAWRDAFRLSEMLCQPVFATPNSGGWSCWLLSRGLGLSQCSSIPESHPTVQALLRTWSRFFQGAGEVFLQIYNGDGGLFVERALQLLSCREWLGRIRVVGIDPSFFVRSTHNVHFYMTSGSLSRLLDVSGLMQARIANRVSVVPFSPYTQSIVPEVWDACYECALRFEFMHLAGIASFGFSSRESVLNQEIRHFDARLIRIVDSERSLAFSRLEAVLRADTTSSVRSGNVFPIPSLRMTILVHTLVRHAITSTKTAYQYDGLSFGNVLDSAFVAAYAGETIGEIFLLFTNEPRIARHTRLLRMLARLLSANGWAAGVMELVYSGILSVSLLIRGSAGACQIQLLMWFTVTVGSVTAIELSQWYFPSIWGRIQNLGMRLTTPAMYREEQEIESASALIPLQQDCRRRRFSNRQYRAVLLSAELIALLADSVILIMFEGVDFWGLGLPEYCRSQSCTNATASVLPSSNVTTIAPNQTAVCSDDATTPRPVFPPITGSYAQDVSEGGVAAVAATIRMIWVGVLLLYFLYAAFRLVREARRGGR